MPLLSLPNEILLQIAEGLDSVKATYALFLTNRRLANLLAPVLLNYAIHNGRHCVTALYLAATNADVKMIRLLLEKGTNIRIIDDDDMRRSVTDDNVDKLLKLLLEQGAHSIIQDHVCGGTALHFAAECGHEGVTRLLLERGMNASVKDMFGRTALQWAAVEGHETIVRLLLENGVDVNGGDYDDITALHRAAERGCDNVVRLLLEKGANVDAQDSERATPLHWAAELKNLPTVRLLIELGADHTIKNSGGVAPLDDVTDEKTLQLALAPRKTKTYPDATRR